MGARRRDGLPVLSSDAVRSEAAHALHAETGLTTTLATDVGDDLYECGLVVPVGNLVPGGVRVHVTARAVARTDEQGQVVALTGTIQDVTARDRAERLLNRGPLRA